MKYEEIIEIVDNAICRQENKTYMFRDMDLGSEYACKNIKKEIHTKLKKNK